MSRCQILAGSLPYTPNALQMRCVQELWPTYLSTLSLLQQRLPREEDTHTQTHTHLTQCATPAAVPGLALPDAGPTASGSLLLQRSPYPSSVDHFPEQIFYKAGLDRSA
uniref:Uncharacterized protein n=1 Tax=Micrurus carvalhoi TaxID=3147026 RepID=A0A2H6N622_9SAUR